MLNIFANMVWPALYVGATFGRFWFLVIGTIVIESVLLRRFLRISWKESLLLSSVGNIFSGAVGTIAMMVAMLFWHIIVDNLTDSTFHMLNWVATYVIMCLGSIFLEVVAVKKMCTLPTRKLFPLMLIGNILSYIFIACFIAFRSN
jgi:hypothetical protein